MYLAVKCRIAPNNSQARVANKKLVFDSVPDIDSPNTIAAIGAITPVTIVAAATVLTHVAVSLTRSLWISGMESESTMRAAPVPCCASMLHCKGFVAADWAGPPPTHARQIA